MHKTAVLACILAFVLLSQTTVVYALIAPGTPAPDFTLSDIHGNSYTLSAQTGKVVMLWFFFTANGADQAAVPDVKTVRAAFGSDFVLWALDAWDTVAEMQTWETTYTTTWPLLTDNANANTAYGITAAPTLVIIDTAGVVQFTHVGNPGSATLISEITSLLPANLPPIADFVWSPPTPKPGEVVAFDASGSTDPDGTIVSYAWDFGDGATGTGVGPVHTYAVEGDFTVQLAVTDNEGYTSSVSEVVPVRMEHATWGYLWLTDSANNQRSRFYQGETICVYIYLEPTGSIADIKVVDEHGNPTGNSWTHVLSGTVSFAAPSTSGVYLVVLEGANPNPLAAEAFDVVSPVVTVASPNGGQSWVRGSYHTIRWSSAGNVGAYVKIELLKGGVVNRVLSYSTPNDGSWGWTISSTQTLGADYKIRITSTSMPTITDSSDGKFAIVRGTLTVTSPNGGESWKHGTTHTITWSKSGSTGSYVKIELLKGGVVVRTITSSTYNDGSYSWYIPSTQTPGTNYKIRITSTAYSSIKDSSNGNFLIVT